MQDIIGEINGSLARGLMLGVKKNIRNKTNLMNVGEEEEKT